MALSYAVDHANASTESVNVEVAAKSELTLVSTDVDPKTGAVTSTYLLASGDANFPSYVTYRAEQQTRGGKSVRRVSMTFSTWATETDSVTGVVRHEPLNGTYSFVVPMAYTVELADMDDFIGNCFSFLYASVSAGARSTTYLQKLLYGAPQVA
jgi:hypothetical protein